MVLITVVMHLRNNICYFVDDIYLSKGVAKQRAISRHTFTSSEWFPTTPVTVVISYHCSAHC